jgi:hypothetical protein
MRQGATKGDEFADQGIVAPVSIAAFLSQQIVEDEFGLGERRVALDEAGIPKFSKGNGDEAGGDRSLTGAPVLETFEHPFAPWKSADLGRGWGHELRQKSSTVFAKDSSSMAGNFLS